MTDTPTPHESPWRIRREERGKTTDVIHAGGALAARGDTMSF